MIIFGLQEALPVTVVSMARCCPRCKSKAVRLDMSLAGRAVWAGCGMVLPQNDPKQINHLPPFKKAQGSFGQTTKTIIACLIPACLLGAHIYIWNNPRLVSRLMAPYSESARKSWHIKTPADIELLIGKAQEADMTAAPQESADAIRSIASRLIAKDVRILISDNVAEGAGGEWDPGLGELKIRPSTVSMGTATLAEAFAHEAAHVAQSCRAGGIYRSSEPMGIPVDPAKTYQQQLDSALYKGLLSDKAIELEAFTVGALPEWAPEILDHYCK